MKQNKITYLHSNLDQIEIVCCKDIEINYPEHNHISSYVLGFVQSGTISLQCCGIPANIKENDFFIIPPYAPHKISSSGKNNTLITVCVGTALVNAYAFKLILPIREKLSNLLLANKLINPEQIGDFATAVELLFLSTFSAKQPPTEEIIDTRDYLEKTPEDTTSIELLARRMYTSKYHFIREFKRYVGLTPHRFQMQNRIRKAKQLLRQNRNMTQVALVTGFYDQSHFIRCFKQFVGITPTEFLSAVIDLSE